MSKVGVEREEEENEMKEFWRYVMAKGGEREEERCVGKKRKVKRPMEGRRRKDG